MAQRLTKNKIVDTKYQLTICHLYPDLMDTYGDRGNILTLVKRCNWRGIKTQLVEISVSQKLNKNLADIYFFGGGQDQAQSIVSPDLQKKGNILKAEIEKGKVLLSICGGYQLLQKYFKTAANDKISGIGLFNAFTEASNDRMIQNLLIEINPKLQPDISSAYPASNIRHITSSLVGFENHSGKTYLEGETMPLGTVIVGAGNNGSDKTEGAIYKNAFGCYLHGSLLPKNPHFADYLIVKALRQKYGKVKLERLDDTFEWLAHENSARISRSRS